jgi:hypothetical protein
MKFIFLIMIALVHQTTSAQTNTTANLIEGGRALIELITVLKKTKAVTTTAIADNKAILDSCAIKQKSDLCFKNSSTKDLAISLYKRTEAGYEALPFTMKVITKKQECWYELRSGIYKYKIEIDIGGVKTLMSEGELKLQPCDNMQREISE